MNQKDQTDEQRALSVSRIGIRRRLIAEGTAVGAEGIGRARFQSVNSHG